MPAPNVTPRLSFSVKGPALLGVCPQCGTALAAHAMRSASGATDDASRDFIGAGYRIEYLADGDTRLLADCGHRMPEIHETIQNLRHRRREADAGDPEED